MRKWRLTSWAPSDLQGPAGTQNSEPRPELCAWTQPQPTIQSKAQTLRKAGSSGQPGVGVGLAKQTRGTRAKGQVRPKYGQGPLKCGHTQLRWDTDQHWRALKKWSAGSPIHCWWTHTFGKQRGLIEHTLYDILIPLFIIYLEKLSYHIGSDCS